MEWNGIKNGFRMEKNRAWDGMGWDGTQTIEKITIYYKTK